MSTQKTAEEIAQFLKTVPHRLLCEALSVWRKRDCTCGRDAIVQSIQRLESRAHQAEQEAERLREVLEHIKVMIRDRDVSFSQVIFRTEALIDSALAPQPTEAQEESEPTGTNDDLLSPGFVEAAREEIARRADAARKEAGEKPLDKNDNTLIF